MAESHSTEKFCPKCKRTLPLTDFWRVNKSNRGPERDRKTGAYKDRRTHMSWCKHCRKAKRDVEYARQRLTGESAEYSRKLYANVWKRRLRVQYGITPEDYERMHDEQQGKCAICGQEETTKHRAGAKRRLSVDHCHKTLKVRRLLCHNCNCGIGRFNDDIDKVRKALEYLERHKSE